MSANVAPVDHWTALWVITVLATACVPIYMYFATQERGKPLWSQILVSSVAFPIWVFAIGGPFSLLPQLVSSESLDRRGDYRLQHVHAWHL
jgi:hypothetical protein